MDTKRTGRCAAGVGVAAAVALALVAGCDQGQNSADVALQKASFELKALSSVRPRATGPETRTQTYEMVVRELQPVVSSGDNEQQVAAARMLSKAQAGLAQIEAERALDLEFQSMDLVREGGKLLQEYRRKMVYAAALVDPAAGSGSEIEALQRQRDEKDAERAKLRSVRDATARALDERRAEAKSLFDQASGKRSEAGSIRASASNANANDRLEIIGQAIEVEREADALEVEAELILAQVARQAPDLAMLDQQLRQMDNESASFERNAALLRDRDRAMREQSAASREAAADETAVAINELVTELATLRSGALVEHYEKANSGFERAISTYRKVMSSSRGKDRSVAAQDLAGLQKSRASAMATWMSGERRTIELLQALVDVEPALAQRGAYAGILQERATVMELATTKIRESFQGAGTALSGAGEDEMALQVEALMREVLGEEAPPPVDDGMDEG